MQLTVEDARVINLGRMLLVRLPLSILRTLDCRGLDLRYQRFNLTGVPKVQSLLDPLLNPFGLKDPRTSPQNTSSKNLGKL